MIKSGWWLEILDKVSIKNFVYRSENRGTQRLFSIKYLFGEAKIA